jgi:hypothetical protein
VEDLGGSKIADVELYVDNNLIYSSNDLSSYDSTYLNVPSVFDNYYSSDYLSYFGKVGFKDAQIGNSYAFKLVASDRFGNVAEVVKTVRVKDGLGIRLEDSVSSMVDVSGFSWISRDNAPIINFRTSKAVDRCSVYPMQDMIWKEVTGSDEVFDLKGVILGSESQNNLYSVDLSNFDGFDLSQIDYVGIDILIRCVYNFTTYNFTRSLNYVDMIPDYVLSSSEGFVLSDSPFETTISVDSVGYYKPISCSYSIDNGAQVSMGNGYAGSFSKLISFGNLISGEYDLKLVCEDMLGGAGPEKIYKFIVDKSTQIEVKDVELFIGDTDYIARGNEIYVGELDNLGLRFMSNKKGIECSYEVESGEGVFSKILNFIDDLFTDNLVELENDLNSYEFRVNSGLSFTGEGDKLKIQCSGEDLNDYYGEFDVIYLDGSEIDFGLSIS